MAFLVVHWKIHAKPLQKIKAPPAFQIKEEGATPEAWDKYRAEMLKISRQLGVDCTYCHNTQNYRDSSKKAFQIGLQHMEMIDMLNNKFKNSFKDKVDCYMCHKGQAIPDYKEKPEKF